MPDHWQSRGDLAAAFRWTARPGMNEAAANHFSLAVNAAGTRFLINPNQVHCARIRASDLLEPDAHDSGVLNAPGAPDPTAWGLHGALHRRCAHARCVMHLHPVFATVLASLADSTLPPIDRNTATFFNRVEVDDVFGGPAFEAEGERCAALLSDPAIRILLLGNHGVVAIGDSVADTFNRLYHFERAAGTYIRALQTGQPLRVMDDRTAERTAVEIENYPERAEPHLAGIKAILDSEGSDHAR